MDQNKVSDRMSFRPSMRQDLERRYDQFRQEAIKLANTSLPGSFPGVSLSLVDSRAYQAFKAWESHSRRVKTWDWQGEFTTWKLRYPKRFEAATWKSGKLIGFSLGKPTFRGTGLRLDFIEKSPNCDEPLLDITYIALLAYSGLIGADHIKIMYPVNKVVRDYYVSKGFAYHAKQDCCIRRL